MPAEVIQATYGDLETIAIRFRQRSEACSELRRRVISRIDHLRKGGWEGRGAAAFFIEVDNELLPALQRLVDVCTQGSDVTREIIATLQTAEVEAARPFHSSGHAAAPGVAASTAGTGVGGSGAAGTGAAPAKPPTANELIYNLMILRENDQAAFLGFLYKNELAVYSMLSPYGFKGSWINDELYLKDFDQAITRWFEKTHYLPDPATQFLQLPAGPDPDEVVLDALPDGTGFVGTRRSFQRAAQAQYAQRALRTLDNIRGGIGGTIGYALGGDQGSDLGAVVDGVAGVAGPMAGARSASRSRVPAGSSQPAAPASPRLPPAQQAGSPQPNNPGSQSASAGGLADRGYRPQPGERSTTREQWRAESSQARWKRSVDQAFEGALEDQAGTPKVTGGKSNRRIDDTRIPPPPKTRMDIQDVPRMPGETAREAVARVRTVVGKKLSDIPQLAQHWNDARAQILKNNTLTAANKTELYEKTRELFYQNVRQDPAAVKVFTDAGFRLPPGKTTAPVLAGVGPNIPVQETRISLDHIVEKARGRNWQKALDADNLRLEFERPNSQREVIQSRHPELREP